MPGITLETSSQQDRNGAFPCGGDSLAEEIGIYTN